MTERGEVRTGAGRMVDAFLAARWFQGLYDTPLLFSGILDRSGRVLAGNTLSIEGCGLDRDKILGHPFWEGGWWSPDPALAEQVRRWCEATVATGAPIRADSRYFLGNGVERMVDLALFPVRDEGGAVTHVVATGIDITDAMATQRQRQERELAYARDAERLAAERLDQLSEIATKLVDAETVGDLARIVVGPGLEVLGADGATLAVRDDRVGVVRLSVSDEPSADGPTGHAELPLTSPLPAAHVARTGETVLFRSQDEGLAWSPATQALYDATGRVAWATLPLQIGDRLLGALGITWKAERDFSEDELGLLRGFAAQCAQALHRVQRLEADRATAASVRLMSEMLQRSSLTQPPTPEALAIAVRYQPAEQAAQIGGDWYDAFVDAAGGTVLTIGDVNGHDRTAAATMGQVRNLLRGLAFDSSDGPGRLLTRLDAALAGLHLETLATAVAARIDPDPTAEGVRRLRWSNAGHLPPLLRTPDGTVRRLDTSPNLLLGVAPTAPRDEHTVDLAPGATLLLYTDGLVERRDTSLDAGIDRLAWMLSELGGLDPEELCDILVESAALNGAGEDDIALLVLRSLG
ncbi:MAG: SpoIIE family protein phosphatase [Nocardioidaceae bacterium]